MKGLWRLAAELSSILPCALDFKYALIGLALGVAISAGFLALKICVIRRHLSDSDSADLKNTPQGKGPVTNRACTALRKKGLSVGPSYYCNETSEAINLKRGKGLGLTVWGFWSMHYWSSWLVMVLHSIECVEEDAGSSWKEEARTLQFLSKMCP
ncbi:Transmembrane protein 273 [Lemmus lemmus]